MTRGHEFALGTYYACCNEEWVIKVLGEPIITIAYKPTYEFI